MRRPTTTPKFVNLRHRAVARAILSHIVVHADVVDHDRRGRPILRFEFAADDWLVDKFAALDAHQEDCKDDDPGEESDD